jgi:co-chaperonin GroES (HSP10)
LKAINYYIVIDKIKEVPKTVGGLEITEAQNTDIRYLRAKVISAGDKIDYIKEGSIITYDKHAGHGVEWNDKMYFVITINDVVLVE